MGKRSIWLPFFFLSLLTLAGGAEADEDISPTGKRILFNASICFKELARDDSMFDGRRLGNRQRNEMVRFHARMVENIACVQSKMARLPQEDRRHPDYRRYLDRASSLVDYANAMGKALDDYEKNSKAADDQCRAFQTEVRDFGSQMRYWFQIDRSSGYFSDEKSAKEHIAAISAVDAVCKRAEFKEVGKVGCEWLKIGDGQNSPAYWCEVAGKRTQLALKTLSDYAAFRLQHIGGVSAEDVTSRDGWLPIEGPVELAKLHEAGAKQFSQVFDSMKPVAAAMGDADYFEKPELFAPYIARMEKVKEAIQTAAAGWELPARGGSSYGSKLAKSRIGSWHRKAKIISAYQHSAGWKIYKNRLTSVPERREVSGYVLFRLPNAELCQLRSWTLTESYRGGGRFQKAKGVAIGYVRWQSCK